MPDTPRVPGRGTARNRLRGPRPARPGAPNAGRCRADREPAGAGGAVLRKATNFGELITEVEQLGKRGSSPLPYRLDEAGRLPYLARAQAVTLATYRAIRRVTPANLSRALHRLAD
jgi:hypothetical protein